MVNIPWAVSGRINPGRPDSPAPMVVENIKFCASIGDHETAPHAGQFGETSSSKDCKSPIFNESGFG